MAEIDAVPLDSANGGFVTITNISSSEEFDLSGVSVTIGAPEHRGSIKFAFPTDGTAPVLAPGEGLRMERDESSSEPDGASWMSDTTSNVIIRDKDGYILQEAFLDARWFNGAIYGTGRFWRATDFGELVVEEGQAEAAGDVNVSVDMGVAEIDLSVIPGAPYTDEVIAQITAFAQTTASRHGRIVTGWVNSDGSEVTGATIADASDSLKALWGSENPLVPETNGDGAVASDKAQKYDAYILDGDGSTYGTATVTVGARNKRSGRSAVKAVVKLVGSNKSCTFKATEANGKATISLEGTTEGVELSNKTLGTMTLDIGKQGVRGVWGEYEINGVRNASKADKALYAGWEGVKTVAVADSNGAYSAFSLKISKTGAVSVKGYMASGATLSGTTRLMICDDGSEACIAVRGTAKVPVGFTLWLARDDDGDVAAEGIESEKGDELSGDSFAGDAKVTASAYALKIGDFAVDVSYGGKSFKPPKGSGVSLRYTKSAGVFSGSFKANVTGANGRTTRKTVSFKGVFVDGTGYGATTTKGLSGIPVTIAPSAAE